MTHTAIGIALGLAGSRRWGRRGTVCLALAANVPDLERVVALASPAASVKASYGAGHSGPAVLVWGTLLFLLLAWRLRDRKTALTLAGLALGSHIVLDLVSGPGVRLLWPLSQTFYGLRVVARYDLTILFTLGVALVGPLLLNLVNRDMGAAPASSSRAARRGLIVVALLLALRGGMLVLLEDRAAASMSGFALAPTALHPLSWYAVADEGNAYTIEEITPWRYGPVLRYRKAQPNRAFETAADTALGQAFLEMAQFPQYSLERGERGMLVRIRDLRFYSPGGEGKEYSVEIEVTPQLEVVRQKARM